MTDLDSDYRVHPQYFGYLTYTFLTEPDRYRRLFQPSRCSTTTCGRRRSPIRLVAVGATHVQMWRSLTPEKLISFSSYSVSLQTVHEVDYWATDAIPEDSRFYWKSFFRYGGEFRAVPLFIPMYGDAVRARSLSAHARRAVHPDPALGVGRSPTSRTTSATRSPTRRSRAACGSGG